MADPAGHVVTIYLAALSAEPMSAADTARAVPGRGLEGDRYFQQANKSSANPGSGQQVTLIEAEAVEAACRDYGVELHPSQTRRNIVTRGIALNHLVGKDFWVGQAKLRGVLLCEPCGHLAKLTSKQTSRALVHRGGLRADVLAGGVIRPGDPVRPA